MRQHQIKTIQYTDILRSFSKSFSKLETNEAKLKLLIELSTVEFSWTRQKLKKHKIRPKFEKLKSRNKKGVHLKPYCEVCWGQSHHRHHIILIKNGGLNTKNNLISLCRYCHAEIHPWLKGNTK